MQNEQWIKAMFNWENSEFVSGTRTQTWTQGGEMKDIVWMENMKSVLGINTNFTKAA